MQTRQIYKSVSLQKSYSRVQKNFATSLHETMQILLQIAVSFAVQKLHLHGSAGQFKRKAHPCNFPPIETLFGPV